MNALFWIHFWAGFWIYFSIGCLIERIVMASNTSLKKNLDDAVDRLHWQFGLSVAFFQGIVFLVLGFIWPYLLAIRLGIWLKGPSNKSED